jgi:hypothetical protein
MRPVVETQTQLIWLDDDGIVRATAKPNSVMTLQDAKEHILTVAGLCAGIRRPVVVDMTGHNALNREARKYFAGPETAKVESAAALVVRSPMARAIGNFFLGFDKPLIPTRLFTSEEEATQWARQFVPVSSPLPIRDDFSAA